MLTVDANVWIAAGDSFDMFAGRSREFFATTTRQQEIFYIPSFVEIEIACALARKRQSAEAGQKWAKSIMALPNIIIVPLDAALIALAVHLGTQYMLRAGDALYVAVAATNSAPLVSWDAELIQRAGAITPTDWLASNAPSS